MNKIPVIAAVLLGVASATQAADLMLLEEAAPTSGVVRLKDVAAILNAAPEEIERLGRVPVMPAPAPGTSPTVRAQEVRELLAAHGVDLSTLRFRGAAQVRIASRAATEIPHAITVPQEPLHDEPTPAPQTGYRAAVTAAPASPQVSRPRTFRLTTARREHVLADLAEKLTEYVQATTGDVMLHVTEVDVKDANAATLAANDAPLTLSTTTDLGLGLRRFLVEFPSTQGGIKFPVTARVVEARPAVLARRDIPRGVIITAADVHIAPLPTSYRVRGSEFLAERVEEVIGKEAARRITVGDVMTDANSLPPVMVERGELVSVVAGNGAIRVSTRAKSMQQGRYGEIIQVQATDTRVRYEARVVGVGRLAVLSAGAGAAQSVASRVEPLRLR